MTGRAVALACTLACTSARADTTPDAAAKARTLFELGQKQFEKGEVDGACSSFATSLELDPEIGTRLNLGNCRERQGRLVEAYQLFDEAAGEAARTNKEGREKYARDRLTALAHKLVRITIDVAEPDTPGLSLTLGGHEIARAQWTQVQVALPGPVALDAQAPDHQRRHVDAPGTVGSEVVLEVPALAGIEAPPPEPPHHASRLPYYVIGAGTVVELASVAIGIHAWSRWNSAMTVDDRAGAHGAITEADVGTGIAVAGGIVIGVGVVLYMLDRRSDDHVAVVPDVGGHHVGLCLTGPL